MGILLAEIWAGRHAYSESRERPETAAEFAENIADEKVRPSNLFQSTMGSGLAGPEHAIKSTRMQWHNLAVECWKSEAGARPKAQEVKRRLHEASCHSSSPT